MRYLLDTCVISELAAKAPNPKVVAYVNALDPAGTFLSVITIGELQKGIERLPASRKKQKLQAWMRDDLLTRFAQNLVVVDLAAMTRWGTMMAALEATGRILPAIDSLIAALALAGDYILVTRNEADFGGTGVRIENPWA